MFLLLWTTLMNLFQNLPLLGHLSSIDFKNMQVQFNQRQLFHLTVVKTSILGNHSFGER